MSAMGDMENITLNGSPYAVPGEISVSELLQKLGMKTELVAVELNRELVRRANFPSTSVRPGDQVEVVEFVGGG